MYRYFIRLSFDGTHYHGWQIQQNAPTIQQQISKVLSLLLKMPVELTGCGRTDTGVHANEFFAHFDFETDLPDLPKLCYQINALLADDIFIYHIIKVDAALHARFSATRRTYKYYINFNRNPFNKNYAYTYHPPLDAEIGRAHV